MAALAYGERIQDTSSFQSIRNHVTRCVQLGISALWSSEAARDPFLPLVVAAEQSTTLQLGTGIAVAYGRTPYATAQAAWDLQRLSQGRFRLGIATQVKAHVERRYGATWPGGATALREYIQCCRAIWDCWQDGTQPTFEGEHFRFTLTNPEFRPQPLPDDQRHIPIWVAAVGPRSARVAGEVGDGLHVHAFHTPGYLRDVVLSEARAGREASGSEAPLDMTCPVLAGIVHNEEQDRVLREEFRAHVAFYASTPAYAPVLEHAGLSGIHEALRPLARERRWSEMPALIGDDVLDLFIVLDEPRALAHKLHARYDGLLTELALYRGGDRFATGEDLAELVALLAADGS